MDEKFGVVPDEPPSMKDFYRRACLSDLDLLLRPGVFRLIFSFLCDWMTIEWVCEILSFRRGKLIACEGFGLESSHYLRISVFTQDVSIKDLTFSFSSWSRSSSFRVFWGK